MAKPKLVAIKRELKEIEICKIKTDPNQPRKKFDKVKLEELALSIEAEGQKVPIIVAPSETFEQDGTYKLIAGERRLKAIEKNNQKTVIAVVELDNPDSFLTSLLENVAREDLNPVEEANAFLKLVKEKGYTYPQVAKLMGKSNAYVGNRIALLRLPQEVQLLIIEGELPSSLALILLDKELKQEDIVSLAAKAIKEGLTSKRLRERIKSLINERKAKASGVKIFSEEEKLMLNAKKNMPFFLEKLAEYVILIEEMDPIDRKVFFTENFKKSDRGLIKLGLAKITKRAVTLIKSLDEMEPGTN